MLQRARAGGAHGGDHESLSVGRASSPDPRAYSTNSRVGTGPGGKRKRLNRFLEQQRRRTWNPYFAVLAMSCSVWVLYSFTSLRAATRPEVKAKLVGATALAKLPKHVGTFDFKGRTRSADRKPRIAIVTNAVAYPFDESTTAQWSLFKEYFANKDCYAKTHGYDLIVDSRNHVEGMGFYTNGETGERGDTNVHFNKPYLLRKWLPHYDWVLWLDMDTLVVDLGRPIEHFIEEIGGQEGDIHVLVPQDQNVQFFFSACALLLRSSPETMEMVEDWFNLKDTCPYALYDDQSRLYAAILRMQLRWRGLQVDHSKKSQTDCLDVCEKQELQGSFSWCVDAAIRAMGIRRVPELTPPVAYSRLPTSLFTKGTDTGLAFQGQFGGIKTQPQLVEYAFSVHTKPFCQRGGVQMCSPYVDAILAPNYQLGMQKCFGQGWLAKPFAALASLHYGAEGGPAGDAEVLALHERNLSSPDASVPGMNVPYGIQFEGLRQSSDLGSGAGPGWREMGTKSDKRFCFASLPGAGGRPFMGAALGPMLYQRFCSLGDCGGISVPKAKYRAEKEHVPCKIDKVYQIFPYNLMSDYAANSHQPAWYMTMLRDPVDRVLAMYASLRARLAEEASLERGRGSPTWSLIANRFCGDTSFVQYGGNAPPTFRPDMTLEEYVEIPGVDDVMTKFYFNRDWEVQRRGSLCTGAARPHSYRPGGWEEFHHWQANGAVGALMEYQFFGIWELWEESVDLMRVTIGSEMVDSADLDPPPDDPSILLVGGQNRGVEEQVALMRKDPDQRRKIETANKKDVMMYARAVKEFKRRCRYFDISVPDDPFELPMLTAHQ